MADPFVGEIRQVAFNFAPKGWALCNGQLLPLMRNTALFSLLGTNYGGDGKNTFGLPDLQGRIPIQPDDMTYSLGQTGEKIGGVAPTEDHTLGYVTVNYIIATQGVFPPRG